MYWETTTCFGPWWPSSGCLGVRLPTLPKVLISTTGMTIPWFYLCLQANQKAVCIWNSVCTSNCWQSIHISIPPINSLVPDVTPRDLEPHPSAQQGFQPHWQFKNKWQEIMSHCSHINGRVKPEGINRNVTNPLKWYCKIHLYDPTKHKASLFKNSISLIFIKVGLPHSQKHTDSILKQYQPDIYKSGPSSSSETYRFYFKTVSAWYL